MKQHKDTSSIKEEARNLRKKVSRIESSRDSVKTKSREKAKVIKYQQDRDRELKENRDHWKSKCKEQENKNEELSKALKKLASKLEMSEEELQSVLDDCNALKKKLHRGSGKSAQSRS
jgi:SMC interacting uncharacterized protein involved in chromosome segregation